MTPEIMKQRVAIAQDVRRRIAAGKLQIEEGDWIAWDHDILDPDSHQEAQPLIDKIEAACTVCARGAMLLSHVRLHNRLTVSQVRDCGFEEENLAQLRPIFGSTQIALIEAAFEGRWFGWDREADDGHSHAAIAFGEKHGDAANRLDAIMNNIVANGGDFRPWEAL